MPLSGSLKCYWIWRRSRSVWNDYWRTTQKSIGTTITRSNHPRQNSYAIPLNPYQQPAPPQVTTTTDTYNVNDPRHSYKQQLEQQQHQLKQQQQQLLLGNHNNNHNEDPLALLLKNKYYHTGPQELKTVGRPQLLSNNNNSPHGEYYTTGANAPGKRPS